MTNLKLHAYRNWTAVRQPFHTIAFLLIAILCGTLFLTSSARGQVPTPLVTLATDQNPLNLSSNFGVPYGSAVDQAGDFAFIGDGASALFLRRAGTSSATRLLQYGDAVPNIAGATVVDFFNIGGLNSSAHLLFAVDYNVSPPDGQLHRAIMLYNGTAYVTIATSDQVAPGTEITTFGPTLGFAGQAASGGALDDNNDVLFESNLTPFTAVTTPSVDPTLYIAPAAGAPVRVLGVGDPLPGGFAEAFILITPINTLGQVLVDTQIAGANSGLFLVSASGVTKVAVNGDPKPTGGTFTISSATEAYGLALNNSGQAAFVDPGTPTSGIEPGIWLYSSGTLTNIFTGPVPNLPAGSTFVQLSALSDLGEAVALVSPGSGSFIVRVHSSNLQVDTVASSGQTAPGTSGGATFSSFSNLSTDNTDRITFFTVLSTGTDAIYQQTAANSPQLVVLNTQAAPSVGGSLELLPSFAIKALNNGSTFFSASVQGGTANFGEFLGSPGSLALLMSTRDTLPSGARVRLSNPMYNTSNVLAFNANLTGGQSALFEEALSSGVTTRLVGEGDLIPGTGGLSVIESPGVSARYYLNDLGQVAFLIGLSGSSQAILVAQPTGGVSVVAATGETAPVTGSPTFLSFGFNSNTTSVSPINDFGQVAFYGTLSNGGAGIFLGTTSGGLSQVAITGESVPEGGETFTVLSGCIDCLVAVNNAGQVAFGALKSPGQGIYGWTQGALAKVIASTDVLPNLNLNTFDPISGFNTGGQVAVEGASGGVLVGTATGGTPTEVALDGNAAPGTGGGTLVTETINYTLGGLISFPTTTNASIDDCGDVIFRSAVTGGTANSGYFGVVNSNCSNGGSPGPLQALALQGQSVSGVGTLGAIFASAPTSSYFSLNEGNPGVLAFTNSFTNTSGATMVGQFLATTAGSVQKVMAPGDAIAGTGGVYASATAVANTIQNAGSNLYEVLTIGGSASQAIVLAVQQPGTIPTSTKLASSGTPSSVGAPVTFTATVSSTGGKPEVGDIVGFFDNGVGIGLGLLNTVGSGLQATFTTSSLMTGSHSITAEFFANSCSGCSNQTEENFATSTSSPLTQVVAVQSVSVTISSQTTPVTINTGLSFQFTAAVTGTTNTTVTWQVNGIAGGNVTFGTISASGLYTAPAAVPSPASFNVTAVSAADSTKSASVMVAVVLASSSSPLSVQISPQPASVVVGSSSVQFGAVVLNAGTDTGVTWSVISGAGTGSINASTGVYTPPATPPSGNVTIQATSIANPNVSQQISFSIAQEALAFAPGQPTTVQPLSPSSGSSSANLVLSMGPSASGGTFNLTCDQMPPGAACSVKPTTVTVQTGQTSVPFTLTVVATVSSSQIVMPMPGGPTWPWLLLDVLLTVSVAAAMWIFTVPTKRSGFACLALVLVGCFSVAFLTACSGISATSVSSPVVSSVRAGSVIPARVTATPVNATGSFTATQMIIPFPVQ